MYIQYMVKCGWLENPLSCTWRLVAGKICYKSGDFPLPRLITRWQPKTNLLWLAHVCSTTRMCVTATGKHKTCTSLTYLPCSSGVSPYFRQKISVAQRSYKLGHVSCPTTQFQGQIWRSQENDSPSGFRVPLSILHVQTPKSHSRRSKSK